MEDDVERNSYFDFFCGRNQQLTAETCSEKCNKTTSKLVEVHNKKKTNDFSLTVKWDNFCPSGSPW